MALVRKLTKIGNSVGVILPTEIMQAAGLARDSEVQISLRDNGTVILKPTHLKDHKIMKIFLKVLDDYNDTFEKLAK